MFDIKKLIAGFLILAAGASSSVLIFSYVNTPAGSATESLNPTLAVTNAFASVSDGNTTLSADVTNNPNNLTGELTGVLLTGIMNTNPNGPATDADGNQTMTAPDQAQMMAELTNDPAFQNFKAPDWNAEASNIPLNVTKNYSSDDVNSYFSSINSITNKDLIQSGAQASLDQAMNDSSSGDDDATVPDPSVVTAFAPQISDSLSSVAALKTPEPLASFQKSFVKLLVYENNITQLVNDSSEDPVKVALTIQSEEKNDTLAVQDLKNQLQKIKDNAVSLNYKSQQKNGEVFSALDTFFGIKTADAQAIIGVPVNCLTCNTTATGIASSQASLSWEQVLWKFAQNLALQALRNILINFVQNKVLSWVNGSGAPRFITAWADTLINAGLAAANAKLSSLSNSVCPQFGPLISIALTIKTPSTNGAQSCTFPATTMKTFMNNFTGGGGWNSYMNMLQPNNNFSSQFMSISDKVVTANNTQKNATQAKAISGSGFTGDQFCPNGSNPNGTSQVCDDNSTPMPHLSCPPNFYLDSGTCYSTANAALTMPAITQTLCTDLTIPTSQQNNGLCGATGVTASTSAAGVEPTVTTPGQTTNQVFSKTLGSNIDLTVNAKTIEAIAMQMAESLMVALVNSATKSINGAINNAGNSGGINSVTSVGTDTSTSTASSTGISCSPTTQNALTNLPINIFASGGSYDNLGNSPTYTWSAPGATPATSTGSNFTGSYASTGSHSITVTASTDNTTATCQVAVTTLTPVSCSPTTQSVYLKGYDNGTSYVNASTTATGGNTTNNNSPTYTWSAPGSVPNSSTGSTFNETYTMAGTYSVTVTGSADNTTSTCQITVQ